MPLNLLRKEYLGTNTDASYSHEYCYYCLKDGKYTVDYSMQQMIDVWVKYTDKYNVYADTAHTAAQLEEILQQRLPGLKRWKQRRETSNLHSEIISRIQVYINRHLFDELNSQQLAEMACLSHFHFRRIFKDYTGENIGTYIQRLRLEYIAYKLVSTPLSLTQILDNINIYNKASLSKAFSRHFGISPSEYRRKYSLLQNNIAPSQATETDDTPTPRFERINKMKSICLQVRGAQNNIQVYRNLWAQVRQFREDNNLNSITNRYISLSLDEPYITDRRLCRFYLGIATAEFVEPSAPFISIDIPAGLYAVFTHCGTHSLLPETYRDIYLNWLPASGYIQREPLTFEIYHNTPSEVPEDNLLTDIYIPVNKLNVC